MVQLNAFHDYDIRGVYPTEINEGLFLHLGRAIATYIGKGPIAVGWDMRISSPSLSRALIEGLVESGIDVVSLGMISTEMHYFASGSLGFEANIIISASHNPPQYNGAKIVKKGVVPLHGNFGLDEIKAIIEKGTYATSTKKGSVTEKNIMDDFLIHALSFVDVSQFKALKVVVDAGNGMGGPVWQKIAAKLTPGSIVPLYLEPDGNFPHHLADPLNDENTHDLHASILENRADMGIALDGDADRIFFMDETGVKLSGTVTTAIFADYFLQKKPGAVLYSAICGRIIKETVEKLGGTAIRTRVGHSFIKQTMMETGAVFAGEHSGHLYFRDNYRAESSLIAGLTMMQLLSTASKKLSEIRKQFDKYPSSGELNFKVEKITAVIDAVSAKYKTEAQSVDQLDGLSVWFDNWWFNIRASKTEPLMRLNIEADNQKILVEKKQELVSFLIDQGANPK